MDLQLSNLDVAEFPELEEYEFHPQNDQFNRHIEQVKRVMIAHTRNMAPKHVSIAKLHFQGQKHIRIAEMVDVTPQTVSKVLQRDDTQRLLNLLRYYAAAQDGPTIAHRKAILTRIAQRMEEKNPKLTISAVAELNKMDVQQHTIETTDKGAPQTNVVINQNFFPRTTLDGEPKNGSD